MKKHDPSRKYQVNLVVKDLDRVLRKIDDRVRWADYIPAEYLSTGQDLVAIGMNDGRTKYVDITNESPFSIVGKVCNTLDDYQIDKQFLNDRQFALVKDDICHVAKKRHDLVTATIELLQYGELNDEACLEIYDHAQMIGAVPESFPANSVNEEDARQIIIDFLQTDASSITDSDWIYGEVLKAHDLALEMQEESFDMEDIAENEWDEELLAMA